MLQYKMFHWKEKGKWKRKIPGIWVSANWLWKLLDPDYGGIHWKSDKVDTKLIRAARDGLINHGLKSDTIGYIPKALNNFSKFPDKTRKFFPKKFQNLYREFRKNAQNRPRLSNWPQVKEAKQGLRLVISSRKISKTFQNFWQIQALEGSWLNLSKIGWKWTVLFKKLAQIGVL